MNCKRTQELILTDYIDGQMGDGPKGLVDGHLAHCSICKGFLDSIKNEVVGPFADAFKAVPDEFLWTRIKQAIEEEQRQQAQKSFILDFWERLRSAIHIPRPAFVLASVATLIFMVGIASQFVINNQIVGINAQDQAMYLSSLINEPALINNGNDFGTPIEKYFL